MTPIVTCPTVIALAGPAGSGKSTVADYLVEKYGAARTSFARPLKEMVKHALDFTDEQVYGTQEQKEAIDPRYGHSPRWFLQRIGTEGCRRTFGDYFWTRQCIDGIVRTNQNLTVIEDCRFINEADEIIDSEKINGFVLRLWPVHDDEAQARASAAGDHRSEAEWQQLRASLEIKPAKRGIPELLTLIDNAMEMIPTRAGRSDGVRW